MLFFKAIYVGAINVVPTMEVSTSKVSGRETRVNFVGSSSGGFERRKPAAVLLQVCPFAPVERFYVVKVSIGERGHPSGIHTVTTAWQRQSSDPSPSLPSLESPR